MLDFLSHYGDLIHLGLYVIVAIILLCKTGNTKFLKEVYDQMKYRTNGYSTKDVKGQSFDRFKPVYRLNKATNELELTDDLIDLQELANSCKDVCMQAVLERFLPSDNEVNIQEQALNLMQDDLDVMSETINLANVYREKFNLDPKLSVSEVFDYVQGQSEILKKKIKEVGKNEEEIIEEGK